MGNGDLYLKKNERTSWKSSFKKGFDYIERQPEGTHEVQDW